jgi:DNA-binding NarL/FixJ family response regulator
MDNITPSLDSLPTPRRTVTISADPFFLRKCRQVSLTPRERQLLLLLSYGYDSTEIATHLTLKIATIKAYMRGLLAKLGANNRTQAVVIALRGGLIP